MTPAETATNLRLFNAWRRGDDDLPPPDPYEIGRAIDVAVELLDETERLRAQNAVLMDAINAAAALMASAPAWKAIEARVTGEQPASTIAEQDQINAEAAIRAIYSTAPSVPTALLVAVADLVAQVEIVSRVGFVDTPDDKDSCASFCVAEGTWLELMRCVESLAASLAAAPGDKP